MRTKRAQRKLSGCRAWKLRKYTLSLSITLFPRLAQDARDAGHIDSVYRGAPHLLGRARSEMNTLRAHAHLALRLRRALSRADGQEGLVSRYRERTRRTIVSVGGGGGFWSRGYAGNIYGASSESTELKASAFGKLNRPSHGDSRDR